MRSALSCPRAAKCRTTGLGAITGLTGSRLPPVLPVVQPQIQQHVGASIVISRSTDFSRPHCAALSHLSRCPLNALMPGSETGSLPRSAVGDATAWQTSLLTTLSYYCARSTWAVEHQVQAAPAREPAPLFAQPAPLVAPALARCAAAGQQQAQVQQPAAQPPVEAWPEAPGMGCTRREDL